MPDELRELLVAVNSIPITSAECERGFSQMNLICTPHRGSLRTHTLKNGGLKITQFGLFYNSTAGSL